ncbi:hypothetical protein IOD13_05215 [Brevibacterium casei]|nr:hypothetical protein [Brevibacterium casei]
MTIAAPTPMMMTPTTPIVGRCAPSAREDVVDRAEGDERRGGEGDDPPLLAAAERAHPEQAHRQAEDDDRPPAAQRRIVDEVVDLDRPVLLEQDRDPEDGRPVEEERDEGDEVVEARVLANGRDHADGDAEDDGDDRRGGDELDRVDDRALEQVGDFLTALPRDAEVALADEASGGAGEPLEVADDRGRFEIEEPDTGLIECFDVRRGA